ncbi:MAG: tetratricopeptide repeat protein [Candidatus Accumulibacter appositus]|mgnify:CR=1 FL=1|uniref:Tetratricopeptide repeat protein n=1 Tax=Candidatus Accumulibacter appositus TaxID=1454003 RepID=A0A011Q029_9PROT|nr:tetratricopeptide repeat protein [Accumulibacter sp.]EXI82510.1 MAG: tetratricopeptide repeat protein [Candidatus Accumulibacter appositus]HRF03064.1 tetratricopeptide repeat protein [Accumulibacter sp.]
MKPITSTLLCVTLSLALGMPAQGADQAVPGKQQKATKQDKASKRTPKSALPQSLAPHPDATDSKELTGQIVYQVLLAEVALQRGRNEFASQAYADLAVRTRDPAVLERAIEVAGYARRFDRVLALARLWVQVEPDSKRAQQVLVGVRVLTNQLDGLAPQLITMLAADQPALPGNLLALNRMFARSPNRKAVLQLISTVGERFPDLPEAHYAIAVAASSAGEHERALAEARQALALRPDWQIGALLEAQLLTQKSPADGIASLQRFVDKNPQARDAQLHLARALVSEKRYAEAKRLFEQLLQAYPDNPDVVFPVAILALQENDTALAEAQLKHLITLDFPDKSAAYYYLGQVAEESQRADDALVYYQQVSPGDHYLPALIRGAAILAKQGKLDDARSQLNAAAARDPQLRVQLLIAEATLLREANQAATALALLEHELSEQADQPELLYESALLAERLGRLEVMEKRLRKLIALQPQSAQGYNALGYSYADRNMRLAEARELIETALKLAPNDPFILDSMGWVLFRQGELEGALTHLQRAYAQRPDAEIAAHMGEVLWMLGRTEEAQRTWREALERHPESVEIKETLKRFSP